MTLKGTTIPTHDIDPLEDIELIKQIDPSAVQLRLWHAQMQHDQSALSSKELTKLEAHAKVTAGRVRTIYNPYTGEIRKAFLPDWVGKHRPEDPPMVGWAKGTN
jgi:hypothetical protein